MRRSLAVLFGLLVAARAQAAVPTTFSVQGVLRNSSGQLQSMMVNVTITLYDTQTAGMGNKLAGPFGPSAVMAANGLFTLTLTDANLVSELSSAPQVWLEMIVGNDTFPRQRVTPELFAIMCGQADNTLQLGGQPASSYLTTASASSTYATQSSLSSYLTTSAAASTYATQSSLSSYLTTSTAASTYATQSSLSSYLTTSAAASTYLTTSAASSTYETQSAAAGAFQPKGSYQAPLSPSSCPSGQAYTSIAANGTATCTGTISNATSATSLSASYVVPVANGGTGSSGGANLISAWGLVDVSTSGTVTLLGGYNVSSVTNAGTYLSINFASALKSSNYAIIVQDGRPYTNGGFPTALVYNPDLYSGDRSASWFFLRQDSTNWSSPSREITFSFMIVGG